MGTAASVHVSQKKKSCRSSHSSHNSTCYNDTSSLKSNIKKFIRQDTEKISNEEPDEVDVEEIFSILLKLSSLFELDESRMMSLVDTIWSTDYKTFECQFLAVTSWIKTYYDENDIGPYGIFNLIKYVELFRPLPTSDNSDQTGDCDEEKLKKDIVEHRLQFPPRCEMSYFTDEIRGLEEKWLMTGNHNRKFDARRRGFSFRKIKMRPSEPVDHNEYIMKFGSFACE